MMATAPYENHGPVECPSIVDTSSLDGKCAVVTGGSSGLGASYTKVLSEAGVFVVNADLTPPEDEQVAKKSLFVKCDVCNFAEQAAAFKAAVEKSPRKGIDIVIANAGIYGSDPILEGLDEPEPKEASLKVLDINLLGVFHTAKLAAYYFHRQNTASPGTFDSCLILKSSIMGYLDTKGSSSYGAAKHGVRGLMGVLRRKGVMRVNALAPWYIVTPMMPKVFTDSLASQFQSQGTDFAFNEDAARAVLRISTDPSINGRSFAIVSRKDATSGYVDLNLDDFEEGTLCDKLQKVASNIIYPHVTT